MLQSSKIHKIPFLKGEPRINYDDLEYVEDESYMEEDFYACNGEPFNGIAWNELQGFISEDTMVGGVRQGRCVKIHANGCLIEDGCYSDDEPVGEHYFRDQSGTLIKYEKYNDDSKMLLSQTYNLQGVLTREIKDEDKRRYRYWTDQGKILYDSIKGEDKYYASNSNVVISIINKGISGTQAEIIYNDEELYAFIYEMFHSNVNIVDIELWKWFHTKLDNNEEPAWELLLKLLNHPQVEIAKTAIRITGIRDYKPAIPILQRMLESKDGNVSGIGIYDVTVNDLIQTTLIKLTGVGNEEIFRSEQIQKRLQWAEYENKRRLKVKMNWPTTTGILIERYTGQLTSKTADQLFSDNHSDSKIEYLFVYKYQVEGYSYRAVYNSESDIAEPEKTIRYRKKKPEEYIF